MIYFTTFIFTLLLTHIARAVPPCGSIASPEGMYDPTYEDEQPVRVQATYKVAYDPKYDDGTIDTKKTACPTLSAEFPRFSSFPDFPYIGGAKVFKWSCGKCWKLTNKNSKFFTYFTNVDDSKTPSNTDFAIGKRAFLELNDGLLEPTVDVEADVVPPHFCGLTGKP